MTVKVNLSGIQELDFPAGVSSASVAPGIATINLSAGGGIGVAGIVIDGGGVVPGVGSRGYLQVPYTGTITAWTLLADVSGSAQITVRKSTYAGFPTTSSIVAAAPPNLITQQNNTSSTLTGWTTAITAGDVLEFNLDSATTVTRLILELQISKS